VSELVDQVRRHRLMAPERPVIVLLSGGRDSTCLLDVAVRIAGRASVTALHLNYGLRDRADADQEHCQALCSGLGVALDVRAPRPRAAGNLQAWAREERYRVASSLAGDLDADVAARWRRSCTAWPPHPAGGRCWA
jgi:tRNA(Ile)-lysidine synthase